MRFNKNKKLLQEQKINRIKMIIIKSNLKMNNQKIKIMTITILMTRKLKKNQDNSINKMLMKRIMKKYLKIWRNQRNQKSNKQKIKYLAVLDCWY